MKLRPFAGFPSDCPVIGELEDLFSVYGSSQRPSMQYLSHSSHNVNRPAISCVILSGVLAHGGGEDPAPFLPFLPLP